jgi:hypothetical protein
LRNAIGIACRVDEACRERESGVAPRKNFYIVIRGLAGFIGDQSKVHCCFVPIESRWTHRILRLAIRAITVAMFAAAFAAQVRDRLCLSQSDRARSVGASGTTNAFADIH